MIKILTLLLIFCSTCFAVERKYSAIVVNAKTGEIIYEKDSNEFRYPASLTKIMTAYLTLKAIKNSNLKLETTLKVSKKAALAPRSNMNLKEGDKILASDLLKGLLIISANDASIVLAERISGSEEKFVKLMNKQAEILNLKRTSFANSNGLHNPKQFTTAYDLSILTRKIMEEFPEFLYLFSLKEFIFRDKTYKATNNLLFINHNIFGLKTGFINASGFNLISIEKRNEEELIGIIMHIDDKETRDSSMLKILNYGFEKYASTVNN